MGSNYIVLTIRMVLVWPAVYFHSVCVCMCARVCVLAVGDLMMVSGRGSETCENGSWTLCRPMQSFPQRLKVNTFTFFGEEVTQLAFFPSLCLFLTFTHCSHDPQTLTSPRAAPSYIFFLLFEVWLISTLVRPRRESQLNLSCIKCSGRSQRCRLCGVTLAVWL